MVGFTLKTACLGEDRATVFLRTSIQAPIECQASEITQCIGQYCEVRI
jgi:hypothetical protein